MKKVLFALLLASCTTGNQKANANEPIQGTNPSNAAAGASTTSFSDKTDINDLMTDGKQQVTAMWRLHKTTYYTKRSYYPNGYENGKKDTVELGESFSNSNEFLNLLDNSSFERKETSVDKGKWFLTFGLNKDKNTLALLHLAIDHEPSYDYYRSECKYLEPYLVSFEKKENVNYLVLSNIVTNYTYYYLKQQ